MNEIQVETTTSMTSEAGICQSVVYSIHRVASGTTYFIQSPEHAREVARNNNWSAEQLAMVLEAHERQLTALARHTIEQGI